MAISSITERCSRLAIAALLPVFLFGAAFAQRHDKVELSPTLCWELKQEGNFTNIYASDNVSDSHIQQAKEGKTKEGKRWEKHNDLYIFQDDFILTRINIETKNENWQSNLGGRIVATPIFWEGTIFVVVKRNVSDQNDSKFWVRALSQETGLTKWQKEFTGTPSMILRDESKLIIVSDKKALLVDAQSGRESPVNPSVPDSALNLATTDRSANRLHLVGSSGDRDVVISIMLRPDAKEIMDFLYKKEIKPTSLALSVKRLFVGDETGRLEAYDLDNKSVLWNVRVGGKITGIRKYKSGVLISSLDNFLYNYSINSGRLIWKKRIDGRIYDLPQIMNRYIAIAGVGNSFADIIDLESGKVVNRLLLNEEANIVGEILATNDYYVVRTNNSVVVFGFRGCPSE